MGLICCFCFVVFFLFDYYSLVNLTIFVLEYLLHEVTSLKHVSVLFKCLQ